MKQVPLNEVKDDLSKFLRIAEAEDVIITRHGKPAGYLVGFGDEDDWIDYQMLRDPKFQDRMRRSLQDVREGKVSAQRAADAYGVVVDPATFAVDALATSRLRAGALDPRGRIA